MSTVRANAILDTAGGNTAQINGMTPTALSLQGFRNRIINGDMRIDQRNNGGAVSITNSFGYAVDRFISVTAASTTVSFQQSSVAPANFTRSLSSTVTTPKVLAAADLNRIIQRIEGFNIADLGWGTASAQAVTLSFWVRASVTGVYTVQIGSGQNYLASYTINAANTWEQKAITIPGSTSGTWPTDNTAGLEVNFVLGAGSNWLGTTGSWGGSATFTVSGAANFIGTNGATFFITGFQLEAGSVATPFERRDYGRELAMCQRYYVRLGSDGAPFATWGTGVVNASTVIQGCSLRLPVTMRTQPTLDFSNVRAYDGAGASAISSLASVSLLSNANAIGFDANCATATLTAFRPAIIQSNNNAAGFFAASAEL